MLLSGSLRPILSYPILSDRKQRVVKGNLSSNLAYVRFDKPQGSVLGHKLLIAYVNGFCELKLPQARLFTRADDTAIVFYAKTWDEVKVMTENGLRVVSDWLKCNLLTLNVDKT